MELLITIPEEEPQPRFLTVERGKETSPPIADVRIHTFSRERRCFIIALPQTSAM